MMAEWPKVVITMDAQTMAAFNNLAAALERIDPLFGRIAQDQQRVAVVLADISKVLGVPIDDFRSDALAWCKTQVSTAEMSLMWALGVIEAGSAPPWETQ